MKRFVLILMLLAGMLSSRAQILDATSSGSLARADAYIALPLTQGALDALTAVEPLAPWLQSRAQAVEAEAYFREGRYARAEAAYRSILADDPPAACAAAARLRLAECLLGQHDAAAARQIYALIDASTLSDADRAELAYGTGVCLLEEGRLDEARAQFEAVSTAGSPLSRAANFYLGVIAYNAGNYTRAADYFNRCDAGSSPGSHRDVYVASMEENPAKALAAARRALALSDLTLSEQAAAEFAAGQAEWLAGNYDRAVNSLRKHVAHTDSPAPEALYLLGVSAYNEGEYAEAADLFAPASEARTAVGQLASAMLGQALKAQGFNDAAAMAFRRAADAEGDQNVARQALYNYAVTKFGGASVPFASASEAFEEFLNRYPSGLYTDRVREYLARGYLADEDYDRALERLEAVANPTADTQNAIAQVLYLLGNRDLNNGNLDRAASRLERAATVAADRSLAAEINLARARTAVRRGDFARAESLLADYLAYGQAANKPVANYYLGYALMGRNKFDRADAAFAAALGANHFAGKELADIYNRRGDLAYYGGEFATAADYYGLAEEASPSTGDYAAYNGARMLGYDRDYSGQLEKLAQFIRRYPDSALLPDALLDQAAAQVASAQPDDAVATYNRLIAEYPLTAQGRSAYIQKALTLLENGRPEEAVDTYKKIIRSYPTSREAAQASSLLRSYLADHDRGAEYLQFMANIDGAPAVDPVEAAELAYGSARRAYEDGGSTAALQQFIETYPDAAQTEEAGAMLAQADYAAGNTEAALARWQALEPRASSPAVALQARMGILRAARDLGMDELAGETALSVLNSSAAPSADLAEATYSRAVYLSLDSLNTQAAIDLWQTVAANTDDLYGAKSAYAAAEAMYESGNLDGALAAARTLSASRSPHRYWVARAFILQADVLKEQGQAVQAREYLRALQENYPGSEPDIREMTQQRLETLQND